MKRTLGHFLRPRIRLVAWTCLLWPTMWTATATAQTLPSFGRFPADSPSRLARAVGDRVDDFAGTPGAAELLAIASGDRDRPELRRLLWQSIEGVLGATPSAGPSGASSSTGPTTLIGLLDSAIGAYMTELGHITLEMDQHGDRDAVSRLAPLHPGEQGSGSIDLGTVGALRQLQINFRGEIAHPDGRSPAVVALFYVLPDGAHRPNIDGRWARVEDEADVVPRRRTVRDPLGFCDATCVDR